MTPPEKEDGDSQGIGALGRGMIYLAWILFAALLTYLFSAYLQRRDNPNIQVATTVTADGAREVVLRRNASGHYVARGAINGEPVVFLLDTGATDVAVPLALAQRLGLKKGAQVTSVTANGRVTAWLTRLESVALGDIVMHRVRATILPAYGDDRVLLGMSFLRHLELVQRGDELTLRLPRKG